MAASLFIGHGSPMNAIEMNQYTQGWHKLGLSLPKPEAILCISAHWMTEGTFVVSSEKPNMIYDFFGFPDELFQVKYKAPGSPKIAQLAKDSFSPIPCELTEEWGLDHGSWSVLKHLYPQADVPIVQLSIDHRLSFREHFALAKKLAPLRQKNILILGSGNCVHNLKKIKWQGDLAPHPWALDLEALVIQLIREGKFEDILNLEMTHKDLFAQCHPSTEHFIPLIYNLGAFTDSKNITVPLEGIQNGSISMAGFLLQ